MSLPSGTPFTSLLYLSQSFGHKEIGSDNSTKTESKNQATYNLYFMYLALVISIYLVGILFGIIWVATRDYNRQDGPPWVPRFCRTEACCVGFEPIARFWPAFLWPLFLTWVLIYFIIDKALHATTCCGWETRRSKRRKRLQVAGRRNRDIYDSDFGSEPSDTISPRSSVISTPPYPVPRAIYATYNSVPNMGPWHPSSQSRTSSAAGLDRLGKSRLKSTASWMSIPGRGDGSPPLPPYQSRFNSAQNLGPMGISGVNHVGSMSPSGQSRASSASTLSNSQSDPASNAGDNRPISIQIKRISIKYDRAPSPLQRSESVEDIDPQGVLQKNGSSARESDADDPPVVLEMSDSSAKSNGSKVSERTMRNEEIERQ